jgi:outer membrane biosynthesis protein TonB
VPVPVVKPRPEPPKEEAKPVEKPVEKKPDPPKPTETAKADPKATAAVKPSDKKVADKKQESAKSASSKESDFNADDIAALLNKQAPANGGAKRSTQTAALGGKTNTGGSKLTQSEMDALRGQIQKNWSIIAGIEGADGVLIKVTMKLDESGDIIGEPEVTASGGSDNARRTLQASALRAVRRSAPFKNLPADKYDAWSEVVVNFDPSELL